MQKARTFFRGLGNIKVKDRAAVKAEIMAVLGINNRVSYHQHTVGHVTHSPAEEMAIEQILDKEFREVKEGITANRYLQKDDCGKYVLNPECTDTCKEYFIDDYNGGKFPFLPKKSIKYLNIVVGYSKERDTAIVEVTGFSFEPFMVRSNLYAFWVMNRYRFARKADRSKQSYHTERRKRDDRPKYYAQQERFYADFAYHLN